MKQTDRTQRTTAKILTSESALRAKNPHEHLYMGILPTDDALLRTKGAGDVDFYRALVSDDAVFSCLQKRTLAQISRPWSIIPAAGVEADGEIADILTQALTRARINATVEGLMEALITGFSVFEIVWAYEDGHWLPARFIGRDPSRFVWAETETTGQYGLHLRTRSNLIRGEPVPPMKFIVHHARTRDGNPNGESLGRQLYWPVYFKKRAVIAWNKLNDRFGSPTPWGRYPRNASAEEKTTLAQALAAFSNDGYIATPEGTMIELLASSMTGNVTSQRELCNYMDDAIAAIILGKERAQNNGGAQAAAAIERENVRLELVRADAELICDTLTSTVIAWACELNGWPPHQFTRPVTPNLDRESESRADATIASMGYRLSLDAVREKYGEGWNEYDPHAHASPPSAVCHSLPPEGDGGERRSIASPAGVGSRFSGDVDARALGRPRGALDAPKSPAADAGMPTPAASFAAAAGNGQQTTAHPIDRILATALGDWRDVIRPLADPALDLIDRARAEGWPVDKIVSALAALPADMNAAPLAERLARATLTARIEAAQNEGLI